MQQETKGHNTEREEIGIKLHCGRFNQWRALRKEKGECKIHIYIKTYKSYTEREIMGQMLEMQ